MTSPALTLTFDLNSLPLKDNAALENLIHTNNSTRSSPPLTSSLDDKRSTLAEKKFKE